MSTMSKVNKKQNFKMSSDTNNLKMSPDEKSGKKISSKKKYMIIGGVVVVIIIIIAVVLGVTLSKPAPKLQKTVGTEIPDKSMSDKVQSAFWGAKFDLTCPRGEYITHLHGHKYIALINGLAATCSGGSQVGDKTILDLLSKNSELIQDNAATTATK